MKTLMHEEKKLKKEIDYIVDEQGRLVFTRSFHLNRGHCCGNGCTHCPYDGLRGSRRIIRRD